MNDENAVHFLGILILGSENRGICHHSTTFFSFLDARKEGKRKSRPLPRPRKLTGYMIDLENALIFWGFRVGAYCIRPTEHHFNDDECQKRITFWGYNDLNVRERYKKTAPPLGRCRLRYGIRRVYRPIFPFLYRSTTTRLARVRACTPGAYMAAQRMAGRMNDPAYEACNRTRNVFVSPLFRSK